MLHHSSFLTGAVGFYLPPVDGSSERLWDILNGGMANAIPPLPFIRDSVTWTPPFPVPAAA